jgi:hypothetical protein
MSTASASLVGELENAKKIVRYKPDGNRKAQRCLFLTSDAVKEYNNDQSAAILLAKRGPIKNALDHWTLGKRIWGHESRGKFSEGRFLKPLHPPPHHIWEIKVTEPIIQIRLFVMFIERDMLLLTSLHARGFLDENDNWKKVMEASAKSWASLFPNNNPLVGQSIGDYISENYDEFPIATKAPGKKRIGRLRTRSGS